MCVFVPQRWRSCCASFVSSWTCWTGSIWAPGCERGNCICPTSCSESSPRKVRSEDALPQNTRSEPIFKPQSQARLANYANVVGKDEKTPDECNVLNFHLFFVSLWFLPRAFIQVRDPQQSAGPSTDAPPGDSTPLAGELFYFIKWETTESSQFTAHTQGHRENIQPGLGIKAPNCKHANKK